MCTAISFQSKDHYFGRNLDLEYNYNESVTVCPRNYPFHLRLEDSLNTHYAMIGMATVVDDYPLYYDATNEYGLSAAGLNFPGNAVYKARSNDGYNIAPFEFIPWILSRCKSVADVRYYLNKTNIVNIQFNDSFPLSPLHWILSDKLESITVEPMENGLHVINNPVGVLTNNPPFDYHLYHLANYMNLTREIPANRFSSRVDLKPYSSGMGGIGLPGDLSSSSRFIKAAFTKLNSVCGESESESISQFFHILSSVEQQQGCVRVGEKYEKTVYSSCCNTDKGIYYYKTYYNSQITAVQLRNTDINGEQLISFPLVKDQQIRFENK